MACATFPREMREMADAVVEAAACWRRSCRSSIRSRKTTRPSPRCASRWARSKDAPTRRFDLGLTRLRTQLRAGEVDTIGYIDRKELYELIENVVDKCDDVANAIQSITAKHV